MLGKWVLYKRSQDHDITSQQLGVQLVIGLSGLAYEGWRWFPQEARDEMLESQYEDDQIVKALGR